MSAHRMSVDSFIISSVFTLCPLSVIIKRIVIVADSHGRCKSLGARKPCQVRALQGQMKLFDALFFNSPSIS